MLQINAIILGRGAMFGAALCCVPLALLPAASLAQEVVQQLPDPAAQSLNDAMRRLSRNPESLPALLDAGRASIELQDADAAEGFFLRAQGVAPDNGSVLAGLALVALQRHDPVAALDLFDQAGAAGENLEVHAASRAFAFDLVGQNGSAQPLYGLSLSITENSEVVRRMALSYAISGDQAASEAVLLPLLQRRDLAAYRTRAFALAILGREEEAISIAETMLPARLAQRLTPYLRFMPQLTRAQQAAAANLGRFPTAANIGRDEPRLARVVDRPANLVPSSDAGARLIPQGEPLGPSTQAEAPSSAATLAQLETPRATELPALEEPVSRAEPVVVAVLDDVPDPVFPAVAETARPSFSISLPEPVIERAPQIEESQASLVEAFADFSLDEGPAPSAAAAGAVDITAIEPAREEPEPEAPPPPVHPSRHWVQLATGQDISAFRFDWRRIVRGSGGLLEGRDAYRARWNRTNRLVTGPFETVREAQQFVSDLADEGVDSFRFTSAEGEEVVPLD